MRELCVHLCITRTNHMLVCACTKAMYALEPHTAAPVAGMML